MALLLLLLLGTSSSTVSRRLAVPQGLEVSTHPRESSARATRLRGTRLRGEARHRDRDSGWHTGSHRDGQPSLSGSSWDVSSVTTTVTMHEKFRSSSFTVTVD
eukprot:472862-Rhodomonas_salina.3